MKKCSNCKKIFSPKKDYYKFCDYCIGKAAKCKTCGKMVVAKNNRFICCGHNESSVNGRMAGRSLDEMLFILQNNMTYDEASVSYDFEDSL